MNDNSIDHLDFEVEMPANDDDDTMGADVREALDVLMQASNKTLMQFREEFCPLLDPAFEYIKALVMKAHDEHDPIALAYACVCFQQAAARFGAGLVIAVGENNPEQIGNALQTLLDSIMQNATVRDDDE
jgi:hypothetical protein